MIARRTRNQTQYNKICDDLRQRILTGIFQEDQPLPGELQLSTEYEVSRKTIRKALENLRTQNFICKQKGVGNFVIPESERRRMQRIAGKIRLMLPEKKRMNDFVLEIVSGIQKFVLGKDMEISYGSHRDSAACLADIYHNFGCDAFIWCGCPENPPEAITELSRFRIPQIVIDHVVSGAGAVIYDSYPAWCSLMNILAASGHRSMAFLERPTSHQWVLTRQEKMWKAAADFGIEAQVFAADFSEEDNLADFIEHHPEITAYVCISPWKNHFLQAMKKMGKRAPGDFSWVEFTPGPVAPESQITRIHIPAQEMGYEAARLVACHNFLGELEPVSSIPCFTFAGLSTGKRKKLHG